GETEEEDVLAATGREDLAAGLPEAERDRVAKEVGAVRGSPAEAEETTDRGVILVGVAATPGPRGVTRSGEAGLGEGGAREVELDPASVTEPDEEVATGQTPDE